MSGPGGPGDDAGGTNPGREQPMPPTGPAAVDWSVAHRMASWVAAQAGREGPRTPEGLRRVSELGRVAELHVASATGLAPGAGGHPLRVVAVSRGEWATRSLDRHRTLLEKLAAALAVPSDAEGPEGDSDLGALLGEGDAGEAPTGVDASADPLGRLSRVAPPVAQGFVFGWMFGHLAQTALGEYDLPLPGPVDDEMALVPANLDRFAADWELPPDELQLWVCLRDVAHHAVLDRPHVRRRVESLLTRYVSGFDVDPSAFSFELNELDVTDAMSFRQVLGEPEKVVEEVRSPAQRQVLPLLEAVTAAVAGYVDHLMDRVGPSLLPSYRAVTEALRRRRVEASWGDRYVATLLGVEMRQSLHDRGAAFVAGVVDRAGEAALARLWDSERTLPTPAEVDAPGLWLARIELPDGEVP